MVITRSPAKRRLVIVQVEFSHNHKSGRDLRRSTSICMSAQSAVDHSLVERDISGSDSSNVYLSFYFLPWFTLEANKHSELDVKIILLCPFDIVRFCFSFLISLIF